MRNLKKAFVFYWIDAVFFLEGDENLRTASDTIAKAGYGSKTVDNAWFDFRPDACYVYSVEKGKFMSKKEANRLDLKWIRKSIDWKVQVALINAKIDRKMKQLELERVENDKLPAKDPKKRRLKAIRLTMIFVSYVKGLNDADFRKFLKKSFRVRNFCYSITNKDMWKGKKIMHVTGT